MYSILVATLQSERGKELTQEHEGDAQQILTELHEYHTKSEMAQHENVELTTNSPTSDLLTHAKGQHNSSLHILKRNYAYWIAWWANQTQSTRLPP